MKRKRKRSDRSHVIYQLRLKTTGESYVGVTHRGKSTSRAGAERRFRQHVSRAKWEETKLWPLCEAIRKHGAEAFELQILETVRGKALGHERERYWIAELKPSLNHP